MKKMHILGSTNQLPRIERPCISLTSAQVSIPDKGQQFNTDFLFRVCLGKRLKCFVKPRLLQIVFHILIATAFQKSSSQHLETRRSSLNMNLQLQIQ